jgi:hypothetical protein
MSRLRALVVTAFVAAGSCNAAEPVAPVTTDGNWLAAEAAVAPTAAQEGSLEDRFERYVCEDAPGCEAHDISDPMLDYGEWLATSLGVAPLSRLRVAHAFYVEAGPGTDGASLSLGAVSFVASDPDQTEAIMAQLAQIPDGAFSDGKVVMRFKPRIAGDRLELVFTDSFHPRMDRFLATL